MKLLHLLGDEAAGPGGVTRASFVNCALRESSVSLCKGNYLPYPASVGMLARSTGASFRAGLSVPMYENVEYYCVFFAGVFPSVGLCPLSSDLMHWCGLPSLNAVVWWVW
jgi:hypothetical protein